MATDTIGKVYEDGQCIVHEGDTGSEMFVVQQGEVEVIINKPDRDVQLAVLKAGEQFGEMSLFTKEPRSATVRARGRTRVLTIDKRGFFRRIQEDPSLAFRLLQKMSERISELNQQVTKDQPESDSK